MGALNLFFPPGSVNRGEVPSLGKVGKLDSNQEPVQDLYRVNLLESINCKDVRVSRPPPRAEAPPGGRQ